MKAIDGIAEAAFKSLMSFALLNPSISRSFVPNGPKGQTNMVGTNIHGGEEQPGWRGTTRVETRVRPI